jgi:nucleoid-associated protein YgaU
MTCSNTDIEEDGRMKIKGQWFCAFSVLMILLVAASGTLFGQEEQKMKMDEYNTQLASVQQRETDANAKSATLQTEIDALKAQIVETQGKIDAEWAEIYTMLGTDQAGVDAYRSELSTIESEIDGLSALSPEDLYKRKAEIDALEKKIADAKTSKVAYLSEMQEKLAVLDEKLAALKGKMPANIYDQYTVIKGDCLWKIAKKDDIYGDPYKWITIYNINRDQIKNPNRIDVDQIFNIARQAGANEYWVVKGDFLSKIAGMSNMYNDPTKWTKLYDANKDIINDANLIYPHQVLTVPSN